MLTHEEALVLSEVAARYPSGHGWDYLIPVGNSDLDCGSEWECARSLEADPHVDAICSPEVALAIRRLALDAVDANAEHIVEAITGSISDLLAALNLDVDAYGATLNDRPFEVASRLRQFAAA